MRECQLTLNYDALRHNLALTKTYAPNASIVAMVKANAYGHGLVNVAMALEKHVGYFGVACLSEGIQLREAGCRARILLMEGFFSADELFEIQAYGLSVVLHENWQVNALLASSCQKKIDVWLKFDSGMHRLGFNPISFVAAIESLSKCKWVGNDIKLMTHFACADGYDPRFTKQQHETFLKIVKRYPHFSLSAANSAAVLSLPTSHHQYIRPGLMLYGATPIAAQSASQLSLQAVMIFSSKIIAIRQCKRGESVGYGAHWVAPKPSTIATVAVGYGDGYPRHINDKAVVSINGQRVPIVGRVSMDMLTVDISALVNIQIGQRVILWGQELSIDDVAAFSHTISYDLLCRMGLNAYR